MRTHRSKLDILNGLTLRALLGGVLIAIALMAATLLSGASPVTAVDADGDGFDSAVETALGSDPSDPTSTPEHLFLPLTCGDGIDNDGDGLTDIADTAAAGYPTTSSDGGCDGDADGDGFSDLTEIDALSRPYAAAGAASQPEDISVADSCSDGVDNDGDGGTDLGPTFPFIADEGCLDDDNDCHSHAR